MKIDETLIDRLAVLSKLEFNATDKAEIQKNLNNILKLVEKLQEVDTEGVEPLIYMNEDIDVFREDKVIETISKQEALKNAPSKDSDYIKVPKVISK
ncbi:MAG: Asp-tRNA(Asn)/Glu-tRNA(Gln) amidotransferase subunit GatC [Chitinophagales bacterium]|nr:Asp-tRNA(Asn)/Glu-tRNA(Gln) amidotransferase subunit GatC [Bacteroidota bacterium]MCB9227600.1 Asp-tRNA(Asn)/Glu-tRNA(Gln) amidotransferase subunit GatC [Chitinophagales bacterium]